MFDANGIADGVNECVLGGVTGDIIHGKAQQVIVVDEFSFCRYTKNEHVSRHTLKLQRTETLSVVKGDQILSAGVVDERLQRNNQLMEQSSSDGVTRRLTAVIKGVLHPGGRCDGSIAVLEESSGNQTVELPDTGGARGVTTFIGS